MKTNQELSKIFVSYVRNSVIRRKRELYRNESKRITMVPVKDEVLEEIIGSSMHMTSLENAMPSDIAQLELYIENPRLGEIIGDLTIRQKIIVYYKFVAEYSDAEIGLLLGITSQAISKARRKIRDELSEKYFKA